MSIQVGSVFADRYSIEGLLGEGGMGSVYRAYDRTLDRRVALKVVRIEGSGSGGSSATGPQARARLLREARSAAAFTHANAVAVYDVGEVDGITYIAMELIEGRSLRPFVNDPSTPLDRKIFWLRDVARALSAAHKRGIIHRDVKPENVMISEDGTVKVLDFGIARRSSVSTDPLGPTAKQVESLTGGNTVVGTPLYMAPEQIRGEELDARVDQFAWGIMAYELLTGELPWGVDMLRAVADMFTQPPKSVREKAAQVPAELDDAILRALHRAPDARFATMDDLLRSFARESSTKDSWLPPKPSMSPSRRGRRAWVVGVGIAGVLGACATVAFYGTHRGGATSGKRVDAGGPVAITEEPAPKSEVPGALQAYADALHEIRIGSLDAAKERLEKAAELDPDLAAAHLRLIPIDMEVHEDPAPAYRRATQLRDRLSVRDRGLLEAYAPLIESDPVDYVEVSRRLKRLSVSYPDDAEIAGSLANAGMLRSDCAAAMRDADRAIALDPDFGFVWMIKGESERMQGLFAQAATDDARCFSRFAALDCLIEQSWTAQFSGSSDALAIGRKLQTLAPDYWDGARAVAGGLFIEGASMAAVRLSLQAGRPPVPDPIAHDYVDGLLAMAAGDLPEAHRALQHARLGAPMMRSLQARLAEFLVEIDEERGDGAAALADAQSFLGAMPAYSGARTRTVADPILSLLHVALEHGAIPRDDYVRQRAELVTTLAQEVGPEGRAQLWSSAYARPARTPDEAREALAAVAELGEPKFSFGGAPVGRVHLLAGDVTGALADLERGARASDVFVDPIAHVHAVLDLGRAREQSGDSRGACAPYKTIAAAWGKVKPTPASAEEAIRRLAAIGCAETAR